MKEIEFSRWLFELPVKQHSLSGSTFLPCLSLPSKSHHENSISSIFSKSPHQVDMKNVVKSSKHFFEYFNTLETHSEQCVRKHSGIGIRMLHQNFFQPILVASIVDRHEAVVLGHASATSGLTVCLDCLGILQKILTTFDRSFYIYYASFLTATFLLKKSCCEE